MFFGVAWRNSLRVARARSNAPIAKDISLKLE